jgi:hypothetical protein
MEAASPTRIPRMRRAVVTELTDKNALEFAFINAVI